MRETGDFIFMMVPCLVQLKPPPPPPHTHTLSLFSLSLSHLSLHSSIPVSGNLLKCLRGVSDFGPDPSAFHPGRGDERTHAVIHIFPRDTLLIRPGTGDCTHWLTGSLLYYITREPEAGRCRGTARSGVNSVGCLSVADLRVAVCV